MNILLRIFVIILVLPGLAGCAFSSYGGGNYLSKDEQFELGLEAFAKEDFSTAIHWLEQAHKTTRDTYYYDASSGIRSQTGWGTEGNPSAKYFLAYMYQNGLGVEKDEKKANRFVEGANDLSVDVQWPSESRYFVYLRKANSPLYQAFQRVVSKTTLKAEEESRGIYKYTKLHPETSEIEFTYGDPTIRKMSFDEFEVFVNTQVIDQTISTQDFLFGTQIEYFSPSGEVALWFPGNQRPVVGKYYTKQDSKSENSTGVLMCFLYQANSRNAITGDRGDTEQCKSAYYFLSDIKGKRRGDVFNLSSGALPHSFKKGSPPGWPDGQNIVDDVAPHTVR